MWAEPEALPNFPWLESASFVEGDGKGKGRHGDSADCSAAYWVSYFALLPVEVWSFRARKGKGRRLHHWKLVQGLVFLEVI